MVLLAFILTCASILFAYQTNAAESNMDKTSESDITKISLLYQDEQMTPDKHVHQKPLLSAGDRVKNYLKRQNSGKYFINHTPL